jgi:hypothetical protein
MKQIITLCLLAFIGTTTLNAQNTLNQLGLSSSTTSTVAYSIRKLSSNYTGSAIRVRRSSDNTTLDIGFTNNGDLDTATLKSFVGSNNGFVSYWYDQSGNGKIAIQASNSLQPIIVSTGVINRSGGLPAIKFNGSSTYLRATLTSLTASTNHTLNCVAAAATGNMVTLSSAASNNRNSCLGAGFNNGGNSGAVWFGGYGQGGSFNSGTATTQISIRSKVYASGKINGYFNGYNTLNISNVTYNLTTPDVLIGCQNIGLNQFLNGSASEVLVFTKDISNADKENIELSQSNYYGICLTTSSLTTQNACDSYTWNGVTYSTSGSYTKTFTGGNSKGCDSIATLNLTIKNATTSTDSATVCGSYTWNGVSYNNSGTYTRTFTSGNSQGCDSTATLKLTIKTTSSSTTNATICSSQLPYSWNGLTFTAAGSQTKTGFTNSQGCDSSATLNLTVVSTLPAITSTSAVCAGSTTTLSNAIPGGVWSTQATSQATINASTGLVTAKNAGTITIQYSKTGCGSVTKSFTINPIPAVPTITYAPGTVNPQAGAPTGGFCVGKTFTVVGTPNVPTGAWSATGTVSITNGGVVTINAVGAGTIKYTYTSAAGCINSRTMVGNGFACAARGVSVSGEGLVVSGDFTMYPNPAKSVVSLQVDQLIGKGQIIVTDVYGKQIKTQYLSMGTNTIDVSNFSKGMYFVSMITSQGKTTKKLVVE